MRDLRRAGHKVFVITGNMDTVVPIPNFHHIKRTEQLREMGIIKGTEYDELKVFVSSDINTIAKDRAIFCFDNKVDILFDDSNLYLKFAAIYSHKTVRLKVED
jgi:hypothetical protein